MVSLCVFEEVDDFREALDALGACNESAIDANDEGGDAHAAGAGRDDAIISGNIFARHSGVGIGSIPVVVEAGFLHHRQKFVVAEFAR